MSKTRFDILNNEEFQLVHLLSELFERSVRHESNEIETHLALAPKNIRDVLFRELLSIELNWKTVEAESNQNPPQLTDYETRFPDRRDEVRKVFDEFLADESRQSNRAQDVDPRTEDTQDAEASNASQETQAFLSNGTSAPKATEIGPYQLISELGAGGMGTVYLAEQSSPVRRQVALKLIKAGMDSEEIIARFEAERQALAMMEHEAIARVFDAGKTNTGRPYFVMELVHGVPITKYCDDQRLSLPERLKLFCSVCKAIQHAHRKGIIHRDIKPSNVLVAYSDGKHLPKVIDFGVAKATGKRLTDKTLVTEVGQLIGTLEYMSPEQTNLSHLDVDTRSDVYSLGVLLYELLTGSTPIGRNAIRGADLTEVLRMIRESEPPAPSQRLSGLRNHSSPSTATYDPTALKGDLDCIVMKALEKDRERRYESPSTLADDLERFLNHQPVIATPPALTYRLSKFVRRNRTLLGVAASISAILITATIVSASMAVRAMRAERETSKSLANVKTERDEKETQRTLAVNAAKREVAEREVAEAVTNYVVDTFRRPDPYVDGRSITMAQSLEQSLKDLHNQFEENPAIKAKLLVAIGRSYSGLGLPLDAIEPLRQAVQLRVEHIGDEKDETYSAKYELGIAYRNARKFEEATKLLEEVLNHKVATNGETSIDALRAMHALGNMYNDANSDQAHAMLEKSFKLWNETFGPEHRETVKAMLALAVQLAKAGDTDEARPLFEQGLPKMKAKYGSNHPDTIEFTNAFAQSQITAGNWDEGIPLLEEVLTAKETVLGKEHKGTYAAVKTLAQVYDRLGRHDESRPLYVRLQKSAFFLDQIKMARERYEKALVEEGSSDQHHTSLLAKRDMAQVLLWIGRFQEAEEALSQVLIGFKDRTNDDPIVKYTVQLLYEVGTGLGRPETRARWMIELEKARHEAGPEFVTAMTTLARNFLIQSKWVDAATVASEFLAIDPTPTAEAWTPAHFQCILGAAETQLALRLATSEPVLTQKKLEDAEAHLTNGKKLLQEFASLSTSYNTALGEANNWLADLDTARKTLLDSRLAPK